ncbi:MAG: MFS transporter, partial [Candidatus Rokubacteria bacterium]|nr:MFS transporter [Candidatus Rokubacteria bacterium]
MKSGSRWIAAGGGLLISLDSVMNPAFPAIAAHFRLAPEQLRWVVVFYVAVYAVVSFVGGAVGDRVGHGRVFVTGVAGSAVAFVAGALAPTFGWLLAARVAQGLAGGLVYGTAPGIVMLATPPGERGRALGFLAAGMGLGFASAPLAAGALLAALGWRSIFYVRVPLGLALLGWALAALPRGRAHVGAPRLRAADFARGAVVHP